MLRKVMTRARNGKWCWVAGIHRVFYDFKWMWRYGFPTVHQLWAMVAYACAADDSTKRPNNPYQSSKDSTSVMKSHCQQLAALDQICNKGEGCEFWGRMLCCFVMPMGNSHGAIDIDEAFASFLPRCRSCQGISCTSRKRTEGFCDRGRKETRMTGRLVIKALDFERNCAALTPRSCTRG